MITLKAMLPILYRSTQYDPGDALPADDEATVAAWLEAGSAKWIEEDEDIQTPPKARRKAAPAGLPGKSSDGDPEALVGKVPDRPQRKKTRKKA